MASNSIPWTTSQQHAIQSRGGTVLVSAAAGSGKTAVLVERVIQRICDPDHPCGLDSLLIVTFTRAAAQQMRDKIGQALTARLAEQRDNLYLRKQQMLLPFAQICTIDRFCGDLVRQHMHALDVPADYTLLDESEASALKQQAAVDAIQDAYAQGDRAFLALTHLLSTPRNDSNLENILVALHDNAQANAFPNAWLDRLLDPYQDAGAFRDSVFGRVLIGQLQDMLHSFIASYTDHITIMQEFPQLQEKYLPTFQAELRGFQSLLTQCQTADWDSLLHAFSDFTFGKLLAVRGFDGPEKDAAKDARSAVREQFEKITKQVLLDREENLRQDSRQLLPLMQTLLSLSKACSTQYANAKREAGKADFNDVLHWTLDLLVTKDRKKTSLAEHLAAQYTEILIDEYQDINQAQELLFWALSRDEGNLFMVGDEKQSIYRFRYADPQLFLARSNAYPPFDPTHEAYPAKVMLSQNFRSRKGITDTVNFLFRQLLRRETGEIEYTPQQQLIPGASYPDRDACDAEFHLVTPSQETQSKDLTLLQARHVAQDIKLRIARGDTVTEQGTQRPLEYRDICILLRIKKKAAVYVQELRAAGIPVYTQTSSGFFAQKEIQLILSFLQVLDNPLQDVPLVALMLSPLFGFSPDDLARIRVQHGSLPFCHAVVQAATQDAACADFLASLSRYRRLSTTYCVHDLLLRIYEDTGYLSIVGALPLGEQRQANLRLLLQYAAQYQSPSRLGLSGFLRFMDRLKTSGQDLQIASTLPESANVVRIMTIHKSKGLEFPLCFLSECDGRFSPKSDYTNLTLTKDMLGIPLLDQEAYCRYATAGETAAKLEKKRLERAEILRLLYVALTRAKETLVCVSGCQNPTSFLKNMAARLHSPTQMDILTVRDASSMAQWIFPAVLRHPDAHPFRQLAGLSEYWVLPAEARITTGVFSPAAITEAETTIKAPPAVAPTLRKQLQEATAYVYPYQALQPVLAKQSVSEIAHTTLDLSYVASTRPAFLGKGGLSPAQRGTATHKFMQYAVYARAAADPQAECTRLAQTGQLSTEEAAAVSFSSVRRFFQSPLAQRIFASDTVLRERKFTVTLPITQLYDALPAELLDETFVLQGVIDCAFLEDDQLVIVDYKTDRVKSKKELLDRYRQQLDLYRQAMTLCTDYEVKETILYSFSLHQAIPVDK